MSMAGIPILNANQQRFVSKSPYINDQVKKHIKTQKDPKVTKTQRQKTQKAANLIKASLTQLQKSENNLDIDIAQETSFANNYYSKH
jgi:hypothetical protein